MLKKWFKKRLKGGNKTVEDASNAEESSGNVRARRARAASRRSNQIDGGAKKSKANKNSIKGNQYESIDKEASRTSLSTQSSTRASSSLKNASSMPSLPADRDSPITPTQFSISTSERAQDAMKESTLVRTKPIERPKSHSKSRERPPVLVNKAAPPATLEQCPFLPPADAVPHPTPTLAIPTPGWRSAPAPSQLPDPAEACFLPQPSPQTDFFARELSYLGVASPPSIDTALFAHEDPDREDSKTDHPSEEKNLIANDFKPPTLIEAISPLKLVPITSTKHSPPLKQEPSHAGKQPPSDLNPMKAATVESESDESEASVRSRSQLVHDSATARPFHDAEFFTATSRSQSGSGSQKLQTWLEEVTRSIDTRKKQLLTELDRYHVDKEVAEENALEDDSVLSKREEAVVKSRDMIDHALKETISKNKASMALAPRGILKSKVVESGTIRYDLNTNRKCIDSSSANDEAEDNDNGNEEEDKLGFAPTVSDESPGQEMHATKGFSSSRHQKLMEEMEGETDSTESQSTSSEVYEALRQLKPTLSRDETLTSTNSSNFLYSKLCNMSNIMSSEDGLCQVDDAASISEDTIDSQSIISEDCISKEGGGWMCFDSSF